MDVPYECQHSFPDCRDKNPLFFDFVVFKEGRVGAIEFNGEQHYQPVSFGRGFQHDALQEIQRRDRIEVEYCRRMKRPMLVVRYDEYALIEEKVCEFVSKL
jgi:hypothetical protein